MRKHFKSLVLAIAMCLLTSFSSNLLLATEDPLSKVSDLHRRNFISKTLGVTYLSGRFGEYAFKTAAIMAQMIGYKDRHDEDSDGSVDDEDPEVSDEILLSTKVLGSIGITSGEIGNVFQALQGFYDIQTVWIFPDAHKGTDRLLFAYVAVVRGLVNIVSDTAGFVYLFKSLLFVAMVSLVPGFLTDVLGFIKNVRDTRANFFKEDARAKFIAYAFCTLSRFPLMAGAILGILNVYEVINEPYTIGGIGIAGFSTFNIGAGIRLAVDIPALLEQWNTFY